MGILRRRSNKGRFIRCHVAFAYLLIPILCLLVLLSLSLPDVSLESSSKALYRKLMHGRRPEEAILGELGRMMIDMLPDDLAFTIFVPSETAFERILKLRALDCLIKEKINDTYAILSRVMGFSAVPQHIPYQAVPFSREISFDSVSGFRLYAWKASDGTLLVNNVQSERVDVRKREIIVHIMSGVIMDAEFEQSFSVDYED